MFPPTRIPDALLQLDVHLSGQLGSIWQPFALSDSLLMQENQQREVRSPVFKIDGDGWTRWGLSVQCTGLRGEYVVLHLYVDSSDIGIILTYRTAVYMTPASLLQHGQGFALSLIAFHHWYHHCCTMQMRYVLSFDCIFYSDCFMFLYLFGDGEHRVH